MLKNRLVYNKIVDFLNEYVNEEWIVNNNIVLTPLTIFKTHLNFDVLDEVATIMFVEDVFGVDIPVEGECFFITVNDLVDYINDYIIDRHFSTVWEPNIEHFIHTGPNLIETINSCAPNNVLDIGCGTNYFKNKIYNVTGIDPVRPEADIKTTLLDYETTTKYDVVLILGSINFGSEEYIKHQLKTAINLCKQNGTIYVRVNPGIPNPKSPWMDFFEWSEDKAMEYAKEYNLEISTFKNDFHERKSFTFIKNGV